jgi:hypothetical protein
MYAEDRIYIQMYAEDRTWIAGVPSRLWPLDQIPSLYEVYRGLLGDTVFIQATHAIEMFTQSVLMVLSAMLFFASSTSRWTEPPQLFHTAIGNDSDRCPNGRVECVI